MARAQPMQDLIAGQMPRQRGRRFDNVQQASAYAIQSMPFLLRQDIQRANTYVTTAIRNETRIVCVVRGTVTLESRC